MSRLKIQPEVEDTTVVFVGAFAPQQFSPHWFAANELMGEAEAKNATVEVVSQVLTRFTMKTSAVTVAVEENRFTIGAPVFVDSVFDLILNTFERALPGQAVSAIGINRTVHFDAASNAARTKVGLQLAPLQPWGAFGDLMEESNRLDDPLRTAGMVSLAMRRPRSSDEPKGHLTARVEPSARLPLSGIFVMLNDHYEIEKDNQSARAACTLVRDRWQKSLEYSDSVVNHVMEMALSARTRK